MPSTSPVIRLNNGVEMPALGLGVFQSRPSETTAAVREALAVGYRLVDTAAVYRNEAQVGEAIAQCGLDRGEIFVTTKAWISDYGYDQTLHAFDRSMRKLGLEQLDLYLLHWPVPKDFDRTIESWKALERLLEEGRTRAIGVSNFSPAHLDRLLAHAKVVPAVNQVELHPFFAQRELVEAHGRLGIVTQAWSPIGGVTRYRAKEGETPNDPLGHPVVADLARRHGRTPAQVVLRWHLEHGYSAIPKSVRAERIRENFGVFDFALSPEEVAAMDGLDAGARSGSDPEQVDTEYYKIRIED
jgi:diketogulonate reductase-like aldo/keto reductase